MGEKKIILIPLALSVQLIFLLCHIQLSSPQALKSFGEQCEADCDERQLLACSINSSVCECMQPNSMFFDREQEKCVGRAGFPCVRYGTDYRCLQHASCNKTSRLCECDKGYFETENGTTCSLMAKYGDPCSSKRPCDRRSGMACLEKSSGSSGRNKRTCQCMFPQDQFYDPGQKTCVSYAGGNCSFSLPCVRNAECSEDIYELRHGENIHGKAYNYNVTIGRKCACKQGNKQTKDRQCLRSHREPCDPEAGRGNGGCNPEENLECYDSSICLCANPLSEIYDEKRKKCVLLVGARCEGNEREDGGTDEKTACVSNAICTGSRCICSEGFSTSPFSTCLKDFGSGCNTSSTSRNKNGGGELVGCNIYRGLSCHQKSGTCGCIDEQSLEYDANSKTCQSRVEGGPCGIFEYSDSSGFHFALEEEDMTMMGNHNKEVMVGRGGSGGSAPSITNGNGGFGNQHNVINGTSSAASSVLHFVSAQNREKLLHQLNHHHHDFLLGRQHKIRIRCRDELECVNEFSGETMRSEKDIFHGFCRRRQ